jgi:hypothetical protein
MSTTETARSPSQPPRTRRSLAVGAILGVVVATLACGALPAHGDEPPSNSDARTCPSPNPPNELTLAAGTPQSATLGSAFATNLQTAFANSNSCPVTTPVAGIPVTFGVIATAAASGVFSASGSSSVTVGSEASGTATAPTFTADDTAGSYTILAGSAYGSVLFSLTNAAVGASSACGSVLAGLAGSPTTITAGIGATQSTRVGKRFRIALAVTVTDSEKRPVPDAAVTFSAPARGPSGRFVDRSRGSSASTVNVRTDACGIAVAPALTANKKQGGYVIKAFVEHVAPVAFALVNAAVENRR